MSIWKTFVYCFGAASLVIAVTVSIAFGRPAQTLQLHDIKLVLETVILIVFALMNVLYVLLWKKDATQDYFTARGQTTPPPAEPEYRSDLKRSSGER